MSTEKLTITWDDVNSDAVDEVLERQDALSAAHQHFLEQQAQTGKDGAQQTVVQGRGGLLYIPAVYMALFGLLGAIFAWGLSEGFNKLYPNRFLQIQTIEQRQLIVNGLLNDGKITALEADARRNTLYEAYPDSPYVHIITDNMLTPVQKQEQIQERLSQDRLMNWGHRLVWYAIVGVVIAIALGTAENIMGRNWRSVIVTSGVAMIVAVAGAFLISLFINKVYHALGGGYVGVSFKRQMLARTVVWAIFGMFLCLAPGLVMKSPKKLFIGLVGGFIGGFIGGMLFEPVDRLLGSDVISRLVAFVAIGVAAGFATGVIESAVKSGWLKVTSGVIAGKQFIIYKNPTYLGSSPLCEVYLFKDEKIQPHHAAVHVVRGGYEIEDLNDESQTFVNGEPVIRARVRNGDEIQIGSSSFVFQERKQSVTV